MNEVFLYLDSLLKSDDVIVVGCSGGPDSMALLNILMKYRKKIGVSVICCHINHNVRKESYEEAEFLKQYCIDNNLVFEVMVIEEYGDDNFHNEARNIRYNFFENLVHKYDANYLMTAHHGDDLMETVLMRIVRGSNLNGYSGFKNVVDMDTYKIVRPLVHYTKEELHQYDIDNNVKYYVDSSNDKDKYTRNRYRKYVLPFLKKEEKDVHLKFLKFSDTLNEANKFIEKETDKAIKRVFDKEKLIVDKFLLEDEFIQRELLYYMLSEFYQDDLILVGDRHIDLIITLINSRKANIFINLPNDVIAKKEYNYFTLNRNIDTISSYEIEFDNYAMLPNNHYIEKTIDDSDNSNNVCRLDTSEITLPLIVRTRRFGDKIKVKGLNGTKKVKEIFIDMKIPKDKRDSWLLLKDATGEVIWVPGLKKSKFDKENNEKYDIILVFAKEGE